MNNKEENEFVSLMLDDNADLNDTKGHHRLSVSDRCGHQINIDEQPEQSDDERWIGTKRLVDLFNKKKPKSISDLAYFIDLLSITMFPLIYTLYVVIMIGTNIRWEDDIELE